MFAIYGESRKGISPYGKATKIMMYDRTNHTTATLVAAVITIVGLILVACSTTNNANTTSEATETSTLPPAEGTTTYPLELTTAFGTTTLKARPTRIAVVSAGTDVDNLIALGVTPIFAYSDVTKTREWDIQTGLTKGIQYTTPATGIPYKLITQSKPELIIDYQSYTTPEEYKKLTRIAPVLTKQHADNRPTWEESLQAIARALDLQERGTKITESVQQKLATVLDQRTDLRGKTAGIISAVNSQELGFTSTDGTDTQAMLTTMGFTTPEFAKTKSHSEDWLTPTTDYPNIDAEILFIFAVKDTQKELLDQPEFTTIPAVAAGTTPSLMTPTKQCLPTAPPSASPGESTKHSSQHSPKSLPNSNNHNRPTHAGGFCAPVGVEKHP